MTAVKQASPAEILDVWFGPDLAPWQPRWFVADPAFDAAIRDRFGALLGPARDGALDAWAATPDGALALLLVLDQFPRNLHRGTAAAFASDPHARAVARQAVLRDRHDLALPCTARCFLYLPFEHSEEMADQQRAVALTTALGDASFSRYAIAHRDVIARFGRFPHRNAALGRANSPEEQAWLDAGGGFG